ncbi:hypothetical protein ANANG_G00240390 [Anguilla anguilla]|uniref:Uncharacterized protein n=1 Tax=Anguilla anguilla TaxID=7936 RepID=A0A9D3RP58_ANGAN|nr:hypothetical protein ANANG_G00240390 [Anguilla anguilla]
MARLGCLSKPPSGAMAARRDSAGPPALQPATLLAVIFPIALFLSAQTADAQGQGIFFLSLCQHLMSHFNARFF